MKLVREALMRCFPQGHRSRLAISPARADSEPNLAPLPKGDVQIPGELGQVTNDAGMALRRDRCVKENAIMSYDTTPKAFSHPASHT